MHHYTVLQLWASHLTTLLNKKINLSADKGDQALGLDDNLLSLLEPLHKNLCESLKLLTGIDCEEAGLNITSLSAEAQQVMVAAPSIKIIFPDLDHNVKAIGALSPALANYVTQASLHIADDKTAAAEIYKPSKLDTLLLRPLPLNISKALTNLLKSETPVQAEMDLSFEALDFGKSKLKEFGDVAQLSLKFAFPEPETKAASAKPKGKAKKKATTKPETSESDYEVQIFLPLTQLEKLSHGGHSQDDTDSLIIDTANPWALHMRDAVKKADMPIRAVVESCHMTIAECTRLEIGQVISLPGVSLNTVGIFLDSETSDTEEPETDAIELTRGSLGIFKKNRALKLIENIDPSFTHDCDWLTI